MHTTKQIHMGIVYVHLLCSVSMSMLVEKPGPEMSCLCNFVMEKSQIKKIVQYRTILSVKILAKSKPVFGFVLI